MSVLKRFLLGVSAGLIALLALMSADAATDFGMQTQTALKAQGLDLFGVAAPLNQSSPASVSAATANANPLSLATLAAPLTGRIVTTSGAANLDMMALWPDDVNPAWIIECNEGGTTDPGLQRIRISDGLVETILTGTSSCDPLRKTPWGSIIFGEENGGGASGGRVYEMLDPLNTTGVTLNRATGVFSGGTGAANLAVRPNLGRNSWEGIAILPNGVTYGGDENRPGTGTPGGSYFKFVPTVLWVPGSPPITNLAASPYAGPINIFGLRLGRRSGNTDYGQGTETGRGVWVPVPSGPDTDLRAQTAALKLTGYYRPEDLEVDPMALAAGTVRLCGANTGNEVDDRSYGNIICITDGTMAQATANTAGPEAQLFVVGNPQLAMMDNLAFQPGRNNLVVHEDGDMLQGNNDLWSCLPDGQDDDLLSDGCVRIATLNDLTAEWTGGIFNAAGTKFYVSIQHNVTGKGTILEISWSGGLSNGGGGTGGGPASPGSPVGPGATTGGGGALPGNGAGNVAPPLQPGVSSGLIRNGGAGSTGGGGGGPSAPR